jgi:hypothetical protein
VVGFARREKTDDSWRQELRTALDQFSRTKPVDDKVWSEFAKNIFYCQGDITDAPAYEKLEKMLTSFGSAPLRQNLLFYLATSPSQFGEVVEQVHRANLLRKNGEGWQRIVSFRHSNAVLSPAGSAVDPVGGRFNIGRIDPLRFSPFAALYLAENRLTACAERYGRSAPEKCGGLSALELALTDESSVAYFNVSGSLETVIDLEDPDRLQELVDIFRTFHLSENVAKLARKAEQEPPRVTETANDLRSVLLDPDWRAYPALCDIPAGSQVFGQLVMDAGIHGIVYPSTRDAGAGAACLAVFPQNFGGTKSFVELVDGAPPTARLTRLDESTVDEVLQAVVTASRATPRT